MKFDFVVVGVGLVGCVFVNCLFEDGCYFVVLVEVGFLDCNFWIYILVGYFCMMGNLNMDWCYVIESDEGIVGCVIVWLCGWVLGGLSFINGLFYVCG